MIVKRLVVSAAVAGCVASVSAQTFDCGFREAGSVLGDTQFRRLPDLPEPAAAGAQARCLTGELIFLYEDTDSVLLTNFDGRPIPDERMLLWAGRSRILMAEAKGVVSTPTLRANSGNWLCARQ